MPVIPIKVPYELWLGQQSNGVPASVIAAWMLGTDGCFWSENGLRFSTVSLDTFKNGVLFQHACNFGSIETTTKYLRAIGWEVGAPNSAYLAVPRHLPLQALIMFTERHPNFKYCLEAWFRPEVAVPSMTPRVSLLPARVDETLTLVMIWICESDDNAMNEEVSSLLGGPLKVIEPDVAAQFNLRPSNVYVAVSEEI